MPTPAFKLNDLVQSAPDSGDVCLMKDRWIGKVVEVRQGVKAAPDGCCYTTLGFWESQPKSKHTTRPLWAEHLVPFNA